MERFDRRKSLGCETFGNSKKDLKQEDKISVKGKICLEWNRLKMQKRNICKSEKDRSKFYKIGDEEAKRYTKGDNRLEI